MPKKRTKRRTAKRKPNARGIVGKLARGIKAKWVQIKKVNGRYKVKIKK